MAITLGKLTILVGAGILGSVLAKEGRVSDLVSGAFSGAFKIALNQIKRDDPSASPPVKKPHTDSLLAQVNSLRQDLQVLASNRSVTIVTSASRSGSSKYVTIIVVVGLGYGYIWWKGWKLPDMMFATRRSLSDASIAIGKKLENVYSAIQFTERKLSSDIEGVDRRLTECLETTTSTHQEVAELRGRTDVIGEDFRSVRSVVQTLSTRIDRIGETQGVTNVNVMRLCQYAHSLENSSAPQQTQATLPGFSRPALEAPPISPSRTGSLPPVYLSLYEPPSPPSSSGSSQEINGNSDATVVSSGHGLSNVNSASQNSTNGASNSSRFGFRRPILSRTHSATSAMLKKKPSSSDEL
ncbi:hypothetical protein UlMin_040040 [Ulmus minor]